MAAWTVARRTSAVAIAILIATGTPAVADSPDRMAERRAQATCGGRPTSDGEALFSHQFTLPHRWTNTKDGERSCVYKRHKVIVSVAWHRGAGGAEAMARRFEAAINKPGFRRLDWKTNGPKFKSPQYRTRIFEYSYRGRDDRRHRVRMFGDRFTFLRVSAPSRRWDAASNAARSARTTMVRVFSP